MSDTTELKSDYNMESFFPDDQYFVLQDASFIYTLRLCKGDTEDMEQWQSCTNARRLRKAFRYGAYWMSHKNEEIIEGLNRYIDDLEAELETLRGPK